MVQCTGCKKQICKGCEVLKTFDGVAGVFCPSCLEECVGCGGKCPGRGCVQNLCWNDTCYEIFCQPCADKDGNGFGYCASCKQSRCLTCRRMECKEDWDSACKECLKILGTPKRNMPSFFLYANSHREDIKIANPTVKGNRLMKMISRQFKSLSGEERAHWDQKAAEDKERYEREWAEFKG